MKAAAIADIAFSGDAAPNNGMHPTRDTTLFM
jgi:hypothetical protein